MSLTQADRRRTGHLALALGWVALGNAVTIVLLYTVAPIFGPLNDIGVATAALLQGALAWRLRAASGIAISSIPLLAASLGTIVAVSGSGLVLFGLSGWFFAGLVTTLGYALLGAWLVAASKQAGTTAAWPPRLASFGRLIGGIMCLGFLAALALPSRLDDPSAAPWFVWIAYANGLGWFILLPFWNVQLGRLLLAGGQGRGKPHEGKPPQSLCEKAVLSTPESLSYNAATSVKVAPSHRLRMDLPGLGYGFANVRYPEPRPACHARALGANVTPPAALSSCIPRSLGAAPCQTGEYDLSSYSEVLWQRPKSP